MHRRSSGYGVAGRKDAQALVTAQAELDRNGLTSLHRVERGQIVHRLEEARPVEDHDVDRGWQNQCCRLCR